MDKKGNSWDEFYERRTEEEKREKVRKELEKAKLKELEKTKARGDNRKG